AGRVQVHHRQRGRRRGRGLDRDLHSVLVQVGPDQLPEPVAGEPAEEGHRPPEPGHCASGVEPGAAQPGIDVTGRVDDQVDQRLVRHSDHAVHSTVPGRVITHGFTPSPRAVILSRTGGTSRTPAGTRCGQPKPRYVPGALALRAGCADAIMFAARRGPGVSRCLGPETRPTHFRLDRWWWYVSGERYPVLWIGQVSVVTLPAEIDVTNADATREELLAVLSQGATLL